MDTVWTSEDVIKWESQVKDMTYLDAFLFLTMDHNMHARVAMVWLESLSRKYPQSRLAVHERYKTPTLSLLSD